MKIIIDTDPGIDDAMAIFYAHAAPDIELLGLTTVFGNVRVDQATRNARYLTEMMNIDIPVAAGNGVPLSGVAITPSRHVHGEEGFGSFRDIPPRDSNCNESAAEFLVRTAREHKGELVVSAIAPLTNIAEAISLDPEFSTNVAKIVIMGGAVDCAGNVNPHAEANIFHDPQAARQVFSSGCNIVLVGLDVTLQTLCRREDFQLMKEQSPVFGGFINEIGEYYLDFYRNVVGIEGCGLHDSTALIACTHPDWFSQAELPMDVVLDGDESGKTIRYDGNGRSPINVCLDVQAERVNQLFLERICQMA